MKQKLLEYFTWILWVVIKEGGVEQAKLKGCWIELKAESEELSILSTFSRCYRSKWDVSLTETGESSNSEAIERDE